MRTVGVKLLADVSQYVSNLKRAGTSTKDFAGELDKAAKGGHLDAVADRAGVAGLALVGMAGYAIKAAADFDKSMSAVQAATHASTADIGKLREAALQAGKDTQYSATQAADGITELSKAGVATADVLNGGLKGALSLAAAGQLDVGEAAETAASALTQFKLKGSDVPHVADLLAAAAGKAQGSVHDMGYALSQSGLVAAQFGLSIEDTTGTLAAFANAGLIGSDAGTSFKTMLLHLANPAEATAKQMDALGISAYDAQGKFVGITALAEQLRTKLGGLTQQQRDSTLAMMFGSDAIRGANVLYQQGGTGIQQWINKVNDAGYASKTAADLTNNLAGDLERLKGSLETMAIEAGGGANSGLRVLTKAMNGVVDQLGQMSPVGGTVVVSMTGLVGVAALGLTAFVKLRGGLATAVAELNAIGPAGARAATGLQKAAGVAGKAAIAFGALEVASASFNHMATNSANVDRLTASLSNLVATGRSAGELNDVFGNNFDKLGRVATFADSAQHGYGKFVTSVAGSIPVIGDAGLALGNFGSRLISGTDWNQATGDMAALDTSLTNVMTSTNNARQASELWNKVALESGIPIEHLIELLPNAYKKVGALNTAAMNGKGALGGMAGATGDLNAALDGGAEMQKKYRTETEAAAGAARGERAALVSLSETLKAQADPVFGLLTAQRDLTKAQKDATKAVRDHGRNSKEAQEATRNLASAAIDLEGKVGALGDSFNGELSPAMVKTFRNAGLTEAQIRDVATQFRQAKNDAKGFARPWEAPVSAPGLSATTRGVRDLRYEIKNLKGKTVTVTVRTLKTGDQHVSGGIGSGTQLKRATGGPVVGAGTATSDSIPARLSNGEHVWTAREVQAAGGHTAVAQMRATAVGAPVQRFADGGAPSSATRVMPAALAGPQRIVVDSRSVVELVGNSDAFGQMMLNVLRVKPGVRKTMAKTLAT